MPTDDPSMQSGQVGTQLLLCMSCRAFRTGHHCSECGATLVPRERFTNAELPALIAAIKKRVALQLVAHQHDGPTPEAIAHASMQPRGDRGDRTCRICDRIKTAAYDLLVAMVPD